MSRRIGVPAAAALMALAAAPALAADAEHGEALAKRWCVACHIVSAEQTRAGDAAPTFGSIARRPDFSPDKLAAFLRDPHPKMPNMNLSRIEAADLAAYIATFQ